MLTLWPYIRTNKSRHPRHVFHEALFQLLGSQGFLLGGLEEGVKKWVGSRVSTMKKNLGWTTEMEIEPSKIKIEPWKMEILPWTTGIERGIRQHLRVIRENGGGLTPQVMDIKSERCWSTWWNGQFRGWSLEDFKGFIDLVMDLQGWWWWWPS